MHDIGEDFNKVMKQRFSDAKTIQDIEATPLTEKYRERKLKVTPFGVRNLFYKGALWRNMRVMRVDQNSFVIHFSAAQMAQRMAFNQRRSPMWGVSPNDKDQLVKLFEKKLRLKVERGQTKVLVA